METKHQHRWQSDYRFQFRGTCRQLSLVSVESESGMSNHTLSVHIDTSISSVKPSGSPIDPGVLEEIRCGTEFDSRTDEEYHLFVVSINRGYKGITTYLLSSIDIINHSTGRDRGEASTRIGSELQKRGGDGSVGDSSWIVVKAQGAHTSTTI